MNRRCMIKGCIHLLMFEEDRCGVNFWNETPSIVRFPKPVNPERSIYIQRAFQPGLSKFPKFENPLYLQTLSLSRWFLAEANPIALPKL